MRRPLVLAAALLTALPCIPQTQAAPQDRQFLLDTSTLTYTVTHPLHVIDGVSHAARGKGVCHAGQCDFLIAAPVKSFDSGDSNRDLHMLQVTRGAQFPVVSVRLHLDESQLDSPTLSADLEVTFAGQTAPYAHVPFQQTIQAGQHHITGSIPATISDFKIDPPSFFTVPIKNSIPVKVDMTWRPA